MRVTSGPTGHSMTFSPSGSARQGPRRFRCLVDSCRSSTYLPFRSSPGSHRTAGQGARHSPRRLTRRYDSSLLLRERGRMKLFLLVLLTGAVFIGCGSGGDEPSPASSLPANSTVPDAGPPSKPKSSEIVRTCAELTGQEIFAPGPPVPGFVDCLRRLDAPIDVIQSWQSG